MARRIELHDKVLSNVAARGDAGAAWLAELPDRIARLEADWDIRVGQMYPSATEAYVAEAITADGTEAVLKIPFVGSEKVERERGILRAANGRGYARLLRYDETNGALLLERLGAQLAQAGMSIDAQIAIICAALQQAWMLTVPGLTLVTGAQKAERMGSYIATVWPKLGRPCSEQTFDVALRCVEARRAAFDPTAAVVGHGDAHAWNTLRVPSTGGYKFVDPDGFFIERAHDLSISMREWPTEFLAGDPIALGRRRCALLSRLTGVDETAIWQWGFIETLVNGLLYREIGPVPDADPFRAVAHAWTNADFG